ncbi:hypothetical protein T440DRAFT_249345 [Plenodomus tracheiphilus IPT5]|uniref:Uncharacterized protein n=1 Tax=Plenodomus tracheiphilus IPT5 TaxID=1408161 RepID=A0A6A7AUX4_9PLEO|nr:hypothetical protein T440DRAFT_249345 [Plenodomus tracheiphilus IPT5]
MTLVTVSRGFCLEGVRRTHTDADAKSMCIPSWSHMTPDLPGQRLSICLLSPHSVGAESLFHLSLRRNDRRAPGIAPTCASDYLPRMFLSHPRCRVRCISDSSFSYDQALGACSHKSLLQPSRFPVGQRNSLACLLP